MSAPSHPINTCNMTQQDSAEASTSSFVALVVVGGLAVGVAVLLWRVSPALAALVSLLAWPSIGWVVAVTATRLRFGRTISIQSVMSLFGVTLFKVAFLFFLTSFAIFMAIVSFALASALVFGVVGTDSIKDVPWLVPLAASSVVLLALAYMVRHMLWPLVREFWGVDTGEWEWQTNRDHLFDVHRVRQLDRNAHQTGSMDPRL